MTQTAQDTPGTAPWLAPLTPLRFLERSADVFPTKTAIIDGDRRFSYAEFAAAAQQLAHALRRRGVGAGDHVAFLAHNSAELLIAHFAVPLTGAALVALNTRLAPSEIRYICEHCEACALFVSSELVSIADQAVAEMPALDQRIVIGEPGVAGWMPYEDYAATGPGQAAIDWAIADEMATISVNYTSGTTGRPKGVSYSHRGAYLNALGELLHSRHTPESVYLWTLPMFHCNGWCTTWAVTAIGGTHVCLPQVQADEIWRLIDEHAVTHLNGAPTVLSMIAQSSRAHTLTSHPVVTTAGAAPSPGTIAAMEQLGFRVIHVYGLTEVYGPYSVCEPQPGWESLPQAQRSALLARQGVGMIQAERLRVVDERMVDVPADGQTMGEIVMRGNNVMLGYLGDHDATEHAFRGGWFHSGDLGVRHPDGYVELRDRAKDIVISGGENISTIEVEMALTTHTEVLDAAVVGAADAKWGERPVAFVVVRSGSSVSEEELITHVRTQIARFKAPDQVIFLDSLPRTSTGKVQKYELRERAAEKVPDRVHADG